MEGGAGTLTLDSEARVPADNKSLGEEGGAVPVPAAPRAKVPSVDKPSHLPPLPSL